ncbi:MAG: hypothetical protein K1000chlam1_00580, partial [Candidatus Anoxychlamydiales bacterium]|nr:hypothetical protein [Candidatus Anoxychlamydiales bacterium]
MKYYIATSIKRAKELNLIRDALNEFGHKITYDWTIHGSVKNTSLERLKEVGEDMIDAIKEADFIVVLLPGGKGTHTELGASIAYNKRIFLHTLDPELIQLGEKTCAFYFHRLIKHVESPFEEAAKFIDQHLKIV